MKKHNTRILSLVLTVVAALALLLSGCGNDTAPSSTVPGADTSISTSTAAATSEDASAPSSAASEDAVAPSSTTSEDTSAPEGEKALTITVTYGDKTTENFEFTTDEEFLRGALEAQNLIAGEESEYGLFVKSVNGVAADDSKQEWWCFSKNGVDLETGVDTTPIADGDAFEITLKTGW